ncbi:MAG: amino acid racemase [Acetobacteraceae bacterium]|nr:amino acid racemase [Acetobacteraceae bacterium]
MSEAGRIIGVLGGMGPLAGADFVARLTLAHDGTQDQDHPEVVLFSATQVPNRTKAALEGGADPLPAMLAGIRLLEQAGAGCIAIPCNTAHLWYDAMQAATRLPILHIVNAAAAALRAAGVAGGTIGVMGTPGTLALRLYEQRLEPLGYRCLTPSEAEMAELVIPGIAAVKANALDRARAPLLKAVESLAARGARAVVLGCTEIPLPLRGAGASVPMIDTIDAQARAALQWWLEAPALLAAQ